MLECDRRSRLDSTVREGERHPLAWKRPVEKLRSPRDGDWINYDRNSDTPRSDVQRSKPLSKFVAQRLGAALCSVFCLVSCGGGTDAPFYSVAGTVTGLNTSGLVLSLGSDTVVVPSGATTFAFDKRLEPGASYEVKVSAQPTTRDQICTVVNGTGSVAVGDADVTTVVVSCHAAEWVVSTLAGSGVAGSTDGIGVDASFSSPYGIAVDAGGTLYVADQAIRKVSPAGVVSTLAKGNGTANVLIGPTGVAVDPNGSVYVADQLSSVIWTVSSNGAVSLLAGSAFLVGSADGTGKVARFNQPLGLAVDSGGTVIVADTLNSTIRAIAPSGAVTTLAGSAGVQGAKDGTGHTALLNVPFGVCVEAGGNIYVADTFNNIVRKITPAGVVSTLAGSSGDPGSTDGNGSNARFTTPFSVAVDTAGNVYVTDVGNLKIRKVSPSGDVTTLAGSGLLGSADGTGAAASFNGPMGIAVDAAGTLYLADAYNKRIRTIVAR